MKESFLCRFWQSCFKPHNSALAESNLLNTVIARLSDNGRSNPVRYNAEEENQKPLSVFNLGGLLRHCRFPRNDKTIQRFSDSRLGILAQHQKSFAFSLVEMLMALLVASLLMAALAPVMTKRMDEAKLNISGVGAAQYDKDAVIQIFTESDTFNVPNDVNSVKVTMMGGGGAGGDAFHGVQEFKDPNSIKSWKVPEGVTKLRVYMVGGGGGGASGGVGVGTAYAD